jgi:hypothetical protein
VGTESSKRESGFGFAVVCNQHNRRLDRQSEMSPQGRGGASRPTARHLISRVSVFAFRLLRLRFADFVDRNERQHGKGRKSYHHRGAPSACPAQLYGCGKSFRRPNSAQWSRSLSTAWPKRWAQFALKTARRAVGAVGGREHQSAGAVRCRDGGSGLGQCGRARRGGRCAYCKSHPAIGAGRPGSEDR